MLFILIVVLLSFAGIGYSIFGEPYRPVSKRHRLSVPPNWPDLSIVHISDLHVRRDDQRLLRVQRLALHDLAPDVLCVTGDMCEKLEDVSLLLGVLKTVRPRLGTFVVLGNHEHNASAPARALTPRNARGRYARQLVRLVCTLLRPLAGHATSDGHDEGHAMAEALRAAGVIVLHNQGARVTSGDRSVWIAGCDSAWAGHADMQAAMRGRRADEACLALIHEPDLAFEADALGADLVLAGHTHGGQVRLPVLGTPYSHRTHPRIAIASGFQRLESALLHITAGLGHTIPLRIGCPPEVVWLDCRPPQMEVR